jgi:hypothetical protein
MDEELREVGEAICNLNETAKYINENLDRIADALETLAAHFDPPR